MEIQKALDLLKGYLVELDNLRTLPPRNDERRFWKNKVDVVLEAAFKKDSDEYRHLNPNITSYPMFPTEAYLKEQYIKDLDSYETGIMKILQKYEILGIPETSASTTAVVDKPKAFIAHGGKSEALDKLKEFLVALGVEPLVVEEQASVNRSTGSNVDSYARQADCAIILATKGDIDGVTGGFIPRGNVLVEIGKAQELFKDRIIYLLQAGTKFPTNVSEKVWGRFTSSCMDEAFTKVVRELTAFGILKAVKPPK